MRSAGEKLTEKRGRKYSSYPMENSGIWELVNYKLDQNITFWKIYYWPKILKHFVLDIWELCTKALFTQLKCFLLMLFKPLYYINIKFSSTSVYAVTHEPKWYSLKLSGNFPLKHFNTAKHCFIYIFCVEASSFREFIRLTCSYSFRISFGKPAISYLLWNDHF